MLKLGNATYTKDGVLVIYDEELEAFACAQLKDYDKNYFKTPHALDVDDFVENYLHRKVIYYKLSLDKSVLGITAISDGKISVVNSDNKLDVKIFPKGTMCIDLDACDSETRANFTIIHEAGHSQFDMNVNPAILENKSVIQDTYLIGLSPRSNINCAIFAWQSEDPFFLILSSLLVLFPSLLKCSEKHTITYVD